jgi:hypothetical protein
MPENTIYVGRPSKWGNPFPCGGNNSLAVESYKEWIYGVKRKHTDSPPPSLEQIQKELGGKNLACWCKEGEPCHADVLLELANK